MSQTPTIKTSGAGSRSEAANLGRTIADGVAAGLADHDRSMHIDSLRVRLPAGAGRRELERAIRLAIVGQTKATPR